MSRETTSSVQWERLIVEGGSGAVALSGCVGSTDFLEITAVGFADYEWPSNYYRSPSRGGTALYLVVQNSTNGRIESVAISDGVLIDENGHQYSSDGQLYWQAQGDDGVNMHHTTIAPRAKLDGFLFYPAIRSADKVPVRWYLAIEVKVGGEWQQVELDIELRPESERESPPVRKKTRAPRGQRATRAASRLQVFPQWASESIHFISEDLLLVVGRHPVRVETIDLRSGAVLKRFVQVDDYEDSPRFQVVDNSDETKAVSNHYYGGNSFSFPTSKTLVWFSNYKPYRSGALACLIDPIVGKIGQVMGRDKLREYVAGETYPKLDDNDADYDADDEEREDAAASVDDFDVEPDSVTMSPNGQIALECVNRSVYVWDIARDSIAGELDLIGVYPPPSRTTFFNDGVHAVGASDEGVSCIWNTVSRRLVGVFDSQPYDIRRIRSMQVEATGTRVVLCTKSGDIETFDLTSGVYRSVLSSATRSSRDSDADVAFVPSRNAIAVGMENCISFVDVTRGTELARLSGHEDEIRCCALSASGRLVAAADFSEIRIWAAPDF